MVKVQQNKYNKQFFIHIPKEKAQEVRLKKGEEVNINSTKEKELIINKIKK